MVKGLPPDPDPSLPCPASEPRVPRCLALPLACSLAPHLLGSCLPPNVSFFVSPFLLLNSLPSAP